MLVSADILPEIIAYSALLGLTFWLLYRRYIFSVADPLFIFLVTTTFASVLVIEVVEEPRNIAHYFLCQFFVWAGFALVQRRTGNPAIQAPSEGIHFTDVTLLRYSCYVLFCIYFISNLIILRTKGFALLSDAPTEAKVANFQEGFGIFRKINWAVGGVASAGLLFLFLLKKKRQDLILLFVIIGLTALEGSKGALLRYAVMAALFIYHPVFNQHKKLRNQIKKYTPLAAVAIFGIFFTVLARENDNSEAVLLAFVRRLLYGADGLLFFYAPANVDYFARYSWTDFPSYIINPILGFLRLAPYQEAFGNIMVENTLPPGVSMDVIVGPNSSFYTEGQVFFGYYGAFFYSFLLGCLASWFRSIYFSLQSSSAFLLVFLSTIYQFSAAILVDLKLFITQAFDTVLLVLPIYVLVCFIQNGKIVFRRLQFNTPKV
ncbi:oligosaccharide repeat unit polymerase [Fibrella sp. HMF5335]|uniref:Oligosaccharide repeat unit polymerase n=1 Tax=Fibrella rubiginis TaxID=2817060 RepID=A0A939GFB3_9BACT|nr:oligosaccharide repeat unit polymerase [Fibrella rubiginis]MBO0937939.1 oligosaccharide repeat unit polymerase [Fibrella rubiginis]